METMVKTKIPVGKGTWIVEGDSVRIGIHGVMVANAIVNPCGSELIPVQLLNPHDSSVTVKKGEQIAEMGLAEPCTSGTGVSTISAVGTEDAELSSGASGDKQVLWDMALKIGDHTSPVEREQLFSVLLEHRDAFALTEKDHGHTSVANHTASTLLHTCCATC